MRIKLKVHLSGTRNGAEWPGYGEEIELPDEEAASMVAAGMAEPVATFRNAEKAVPAAAETRTATVSEERLAAETRKALVPKRQYTKRGR